VRCVIGIGTGALVEATSLGIPVIDIEIDGLITNIFLNLEEASSGNMLQIKPKSIR
jgi:hypothetical protein